MIINELNSKLREFARTLSPSESERGVVGDLYSAFQTLLGKANCLQVGSYPRFTAITPIHDLDILYVIGEWHTDWPADSYTPEEVIDELEKNVSENLLKPEGSEVVSVDKQTHSVSVTFKFGEQEFSIDVVPAYSFGTNEFGQSTYRVPEIIKKKSHAKRREMYEARIANAEHIGWIESDPRGYISIASEVGKNSDFRKTVKIVKKWKDNLKAFDEDLKLKSFHLEQTITRFFIANPDATLFDALFCFFVDFPDTVLIENQIPDRANIDKFVDDYIAELSKLQKETILEARNGFLIKLEDYTEDAPISTLVDIEFRRRMSGTEEYLFDKRIPVLTEEEIVVNGKIQQKSGERLLSRDDFIDQGQNIRFLLQKGCDADAYIWKVKNDDYAPQKRGEITKGHTLNDPERTAYRGNHYVECFAIKNGVCIARARQVVKLK